MVTVKHHEDHRFAGLLEAAPDAMVAFDADGRIRPGERSEQSGVRDADELVETSEGQSSSPTRRAMPIPRNRAGYVADPAPRPMGAGRSWPGDAPRTAPPSPPRSPPPMSETIETEQGSWSPPRSET